MGIVNGKGWEECLRKLTGHLKKKTTTQWSERDWGSWRDKPADPQIADLFQVPKLGSPRLHLENNCLFVLEFNLRKLLQSREIRVGSGPGKFSVGEKKKVRITVTTTNTTRSSGIFPPFPGAFSLSVLSTTAVGGIWATGVFLLKGARKFHSPKNNMVDCPNGKGIQHAAFLLSGSLSGPWGPDWLAPVPWIAQASGVVTPTHRESTVRANGAHRDRGKREEGGRQVNYFFFQEKK